MIDAVGRRWCRERGRGRVDVFIGGREVVVELGRKKEREGVRPLTRRKVGACDGFEASK